MTISSSLRRAGPFLGNGVTVAFPFGFKVFAKSDVLVTLTDEQGTESKLVLDSDYSVALSSNQDATPGGTVTYPISGGPLPVGRKLTLSGSLAYSQPTDIQNSGGFYPRVIEDALDRLAIQAQQLAEEMTRTVRVGVSSSTSPTEYLDEVLAQARESANAAQAAQEGAELAEDTAKDWATKLGAPVAGGLYSALFYALQAQTNAGLPVYQPGSLPSTNVGDIFVAGAGVWRWLTPGYVPNNYPRRHRAQGDCTHTATTVSVPVGNWRAAANDCDILLAAPLTKTLQASGAWAAGSGQNGLFTGARAASTWYHVFVIMNPATGAVDVGFDTSPTAANRPAGWVAYRRIWSVLTDGSSNIVTMFQFGARTFFQDRRSDVSNAGVTNVSTGSTFAISVPLGVEVLADVGINLASGTASTVSMFKPGFIGVPGVVTDVYATATAYQYARVSVPTNASAAVAARATVLVGSGFFLSTVGWTDFIGD